MEKQKPVIELELYLIRHGQSQGNVGYDKEILTPQLGFRLDSLLRYRSEDGAIAKDRIPVLPQAS